MEVMFLIKSATGQAGDNFFFRNNDPCRTYLNFFITYLITNILTHVTTTHTLLHKIIAQNKKARKVKTLKLGSRY